MFKQLFRLKSGAETGDGPFMANGTEDKMDPGLNSSDASSGRRRHWELAAAGDRSPDAEGKGKTTGTVIPMTTGAAGLESFEEIYRNVPVKPPQVTYGSLGILRVIDMVHSPYLDGMSLDSKRGAVLMALETVGVKAEDLLQDAIVRQRALNVYEESQHAKLREFEAAKAKENALIRAELDRLSAAHLARIQANLDEVARTQENLRIWTERKIEESQQIAEAATYCAPESSSGIGTLTATVTRFGADSVVGKSTDVAVGKR